VKSNLFFKVAPEPCPISEQGGNGDMRYGIIVLNAIGQTLGRE